MSPLTDRMPTFVQDLLGIEVLGNSLLRWGTAVVVVAAATLALRLLRNLLVSRLQKLSEKTETALDDAVMDMIRETKTLFLFVVALYLGSLPLELPDGVALGLKRVFSVVLFFQIGLWASHALNFALQRQIKEKRAEDPGKVAVLSLFRFFARVAVWSVVVLLALDNLGFNVTALIAGLGVGGVAIALALQNVLGDTFASLSIVLDKPFEVGDFIIVGDLPGSVEHIGIKTTRVRSLTGEQLVFGNQDLLSSRVRNFKRMFERRILFTFGVIYQTPLEKLERIGGMAREIIESIDKARFDRAHFKEYGDSSLNFEVVYYVLAPEYNVYMDIQQEINLRLYRQFEEEGIEFAYPTRTLYLEPGQRPLESRIVEPAEPQ